MTRHFWILAATLKSNPLSRWSRSEAAVRDGEHMSENMYWFQAKRYGGGLGASSTWQGWVVLCMCLVLLVAGPIILPQSKNKVGFIVYVVALSIVLCAVCYAKGKPPK